MKFNHSNLQDCEAAKGVVVVIDVLRAFSTACYAFASGASKIILTDTVQSAFALRDRFNGSYILGEVNGLPVPGFDYSNSPVEISRADISGKILIQRTTAGTQGVVRSVQAQTLLAASFCCAAATADYIRELNPPAATFVITEGEEDAACADYIQELILGNKPEQSTYATRVIDSNGGRKFRDPQNSNFSPEDLKYCLEFNRFNFSLLVTQRDNMSIMTPSPSAR